VCCSIVSFVYLEDSRLEEHVCLKFRIKLGKILWKLLSMLKVAFEKHGGKNTSSSKFESHVTSVEDDEFSDCPAVSKTVEKCRLYEGTCS